MNEVLNVIQNDLDLGELSEITRVTLAKICEKLHAEGIRNPHAVVKSLGYSEYEVEIIIVDGGTGHSGEHYMQTYHI